MAPDMMNESSRIGRRQRAGQWVCLLGLLALVLLAPASVAQSRAQTDAPTAVAVSDEQFVTGPLRGEADVAAVVATEGGFLATATLEPVAGIPMPAAAALAFLGEAYSVSPALLLALSELQFGGLSLVQPTRSPAVLSDWYRLTAMVLSRWFYDAYYGINNAPERPWPVEGALPTAGNAGTYALRNYYFTHVYGGGEPAAALAAWEAQLRAVYESRFGSLLAGKMRLVPPGASERTALPVLRLPWVGGAVWNLTGGPHNFDGSDRLPLSGVDFQPAGVTGCDPAQATRHWVVAAAPGRVIGTQRNWVKLDHDGDGDSRTGYQTVYGHLIYRIADGSLVQAGTRLGSPSCQGGFASGMHVHFGVKFENVWQPIESVLVSGWRVQRGDEAYEGTMVRAGAAERLACFRSEAETMDCTHAALLSDNWTGQPRVQHAPY
jgi:LasA protease